MSCSHTNLIRNVKPSARGCEECLKSGDEWRHLRICRQCGHVGCCDQFSEPPCPRSFPPDRSPDHRRLRPPEGWGWCYVDDVEVELEDQTPQ
jgi:hypothetical protein